MSRPLLNQRKASANRSKHDPDNQADNGGNGDGHGDTTSNRTSSSHCAKTPW
jgi:hypothetical protein